ncbi:MAG: sulfurtransferase [Fusobacteriaceae bacterium]
MKKLLVVALLTLSTLAFSKDYSQYKSETLISPATAKELIEKDKNVVVVDVRQNAKFLAGNVKGSYNMWRPDMEPKDGRYGDIGGMRASREELEKEMNAMGVNGDTTLVLIGDNLDEYRLWWIMDLYGAKNMKIVDGGFNALKSAGVSTRFGAEPAPKAGTFKFPEGADKDTLVEFEDVKAKLNDKDVLVLDTRSEKEFTGEETKSGAVGKGRIPGAVWVEWSDTLDKNKDMKSYDELVALFTKAGVTPDKEILAYCQSAVRSAHTTFVLRELLGYPKVKNYDGSWIEWSREVAKNNAPVESGK